MQNKKYRFIKTIKSDFPRLMKMFSKIYPRKALAEILKKDWDEKTQKQISDAIYYKLEKCF